MPVPAEGLGGAAAACLAHRDEGHLARIVDLREPRQLAARQLAARAEEAQAQIFGRDTFDERTVLRLVFRADRPQRDRLTVPVDALHQLGRVRRDREMRRARRLAGAHAQPRIEREHAVGIGPERVDVELGEFRQIDEHLRDRDQHIGDRIERHRQPVAVAREQLRDARARDHLAREHAVHRRQRDRAVGEHLDRRAAVPEQQHRAEQRVDARADDQLVRLRPHGHRLHREAGEAGLGLRLADAREHRLDLGTQHRVVGEVQAHTAHVGLVADVGREDLQRDRVAEALRRRHRGIGGGCGRERRHDRDAVGLQHRLGFEFAHHLAAVGEHRVDHRARRCQVGRPVLARGRRLEQQRLVRAVGREHREGLHRFFRRRVVGHAGVLKDAPRLGHRRIAEPARQHAAGRLAQQRRAGAGDVVAAHDRGRRVHEKHRAGVVIGEQQAQRVGVARHRCVADDVDRVRVRPGRRQHRIEPFAQRGAEVAQAHAGGGRGVGRHHAGTAAVRHHRQRIVAVRAEARERLRGREERGQRVDAQHAGTADRGVEDDVGARERTGVRGRGLQAIAGAAGLHDDDGLVARRRTRRRHELVRRLDRFDVEQDRARVRIAREVVEQVAEVDIAALAERHHVREADAPRGRPVEHRGDERARLRDERELAGQRVGVREARVDAEVRAEQAEAVRPEHAQHVRPRGVERRLLLRRREPGRHHDRGARAEAAEFVDERRHRVGRRAQHREVGRLRQIAGSSEDPLAVERRVLRVHAEDRPLEAPGAAVAPHGCADAAGAVRGADDRDRFRFEQLIEVADAHDDTPLAEYGNRPSQGHAGAPSWPGVGPCLGRPGAADPTEVWLMLR